MAPKKGPAEYVARSLQTKTVYHYADPQTGLDIKSREVAKKRKRETHFPFNRRTGQQKYQSVKEIIYEDLPRTLPSGYLKAPNTGFGFSRDLNPVLFSLQDALPKLTTVIVSGSGETELLDPSTVRLANADLQKVRPRLRALNQRHRAEVDVAANNELATLLPDTFRADTAPYVGGQLNHFVTAHAIKPSEITTEDVEALSRLISRLPQTHSFVRSAGLLETKISLDRLLIEDLIADYQKLLSRKTSSRKLEDDWQAFFSKNILFFSFGYVQRFEKELVQGDKSLNIPDFLLLNTFGYLDVFEIKTHLTQLLSFDRGRKNFHWHSEAAKAIAQAENYVDSLAREEDRVIKNIRDQYDISVDAVRPFAYIVGSSRERIAGANTAKYVGKEKKKLWNDFRRLNASLKNVRFILYDELLDQLVNLKDRLSSEPEDPMDGAAQEE